MPLSYVAYGLAVLLGIAVTGVGVRFLVSPRSSAADYGVAVGPDGTGAGAYLTIKGLRDATVGILVFVLLAAGGPHVLGWFMLTTAVIPAGDALIVLRHQGSKALAYGMHGATAVVVVATAIALLLL